MFTVDNIEKLVGQPVGGRAAAAAASGGERIPLVEKDHGRGDHLGDVVDLHQVFNRAVDGIGRIVQSAGTGADIMDLLILAQPGADQKGFTAAGRSVQHHAFFFINIVDQAVICHFRKKRRLLFSEASWLENLFYSNRFRFCKFHYDQGLYCFLVFPVLLGGLDKSAPF